MQSAFDQRRQVRERRAGQRRLLEQIVNQAQYLDAPASRGNCPLDLAAVEHRTDAIAVARQQPRQCGDEIDEHCPLEILHGAEVY